ncbi:MAG: cell division protein FtsQ/DivIB [Blastocatellales bacterium]
MSPRRRETEEYDDSEEQSASPSELAERHQPRRTSKHRAPRARAVPRRTGKSSRRQASAQRDLPFEGGFKLTSVLSPDIFTRKITRIGGVLIVLAFIVGGLFVFYYFFSGSKFFRLREVVVDGNVRMSKEEISAIVSSVAERSVMRADLNEIRRRILLNQLVRQVEVTRMLPDMMRVVISEREPVALARQSDGKVVCVDSNGAMFGDSSLLKMRPLPPIIRGLVETGPNGSNVNQQRLMTYRQVINDLDSAQPPLSKRIGEVVFDDVRGVRVVLESSGVGVYLGNQDFRKRLNSALDVLDAIRRKDVEALNVLRIADAEKLLSGAQIAYVNASDPRRMIVGLKE